MKEVQVFNTDEGVYVLSDGQLYRLEGTVLTPVTEDPQIHPNLGGGNGPKDDN